MDFYYGRFSGRAKNIVEIAELFGMDVVAVSKITKSRKNAVRRKYWAAETRKATARRKAAAKQRQQNYAKRCAELKSRSE
jgi:hypothetical protein